MSLFDDQWWTEREPELHMLCICPLFCMIKPSLIGIPPLQTESVQIESVKVMSEQSVI